MFSSSNPNVSGFEDFDQPVVVNKFADQALKITSKNFALQFDDRGAYGALDLDIDALTKLLGNKGCATTSRWINIWKPEEQSDLLNRLASHYGFSPRLLGLMAENPNSKLATSATLTKRHTHDHYRMWPSDWRKSADVGATQMQDVASLQADKSFNHYTIVNNIWHYFSVDIDKRYICVGYNSLHHIRSASTDKGNPSSKISSNPEGRRVWTWLLLCDDATVITILENPYPVSPYLPTPDLDTLRRHTRHVLQTLSRGAPPKETANPLFTLNIRLKSAPSEASSLLFYYLFDDWYTSYSLVAEKDRRYGTRLENLREAMFQTAKLEHVNTLHHYGRQLAVLKRMYQSYDRIIERVIAMDKRLEDSGVSHDLTNPSQAQSNEYLGVRMSPSAIFRFQRLKDRISLYVLNEIQECLDEKEALVQVNFNLIGMKESSAVETLTRITILLAKVTILFLPVSLMTSYFALQIPGLSSNFSTKTYWISFAIVMFLSFLLLIAFGILSGTLESKTIYRSLTRTVFDHFRKKRSQRKEEKPDE